MKRDGKVVKDRWKERGGAGKIEKRGVTELELTRKAQSPGVQGKRPPLNPHTYANLTGQMMEIPEITMNECTAA